MSQRETFSREINKAHGEGGGLNANYRTAEAIAVAANVLGRLKLKYGEHFVFKTDLFDHISFDFCDRETMVLAQEALS